MSTLPESLGRLYNCSLEELPSETKNLHNLHHLDDNSVEAMLKLKSMPPGIGLLANLQTLPRFVVNTETCCGLTELKDLNSLHGELILVQNPFEARKANLENKNSIQSLQLPWDIGISASVCVGYVQSFLAILQPHTSLKELRIIGYRTPSFPS